MSLETRDVEEIALRHIALMPNGKMKMHGLQLLEQWKNRPVENFCTDVVIPQIRTLRRGQRRKALATLSLIQHNIAAKAVEGVLERHGQRRSAEAMKNEILANYEVINRQGRGIVYIGSARTQPGDPYYELARELGRGLSLLLGSTAWTGAGPGQMEAPLLGAKEAGGKVGGIKIVLNNENSRFEQEVNAALSSEEVSLCEYFGPRKVGLVDACMRQSENDRTGFITFPGGFGTFDEFFEFLTLTQLKKVGSLHPVPIVLMNYDNFFRDMMEFLKKCATAGTISFAEIDLIRVCDTNEQAITFFRDFYNVNRTESNNEEDTPAILSLHSA